MIGLAAMRGAVEVAADMEPDELYRFFAEDLFRSASPALRDAMFRLALAGDAPTSTPRERYLARRTRSLSQRPPIAAFSFRTTGRPYIRCCADSCSRSSPNWRAPKHDPLVEQAVEFLASEEAVGRLPLRA